MIWATWRMNRGILVALSLGVAAFAIWLVISGTEESHAWDDLHGPSLLDQLSRQHKRLHDQPLEFWQFQLGERGTVRRPSGDSRVRTRLPLVAGEFEQGTHRLAWTQSITRSRWLLTQIGVGGVVSAGIVGAMAPQIWWWTDAALRSSHIEPSNFDISGFVPVAYALCLHARSGTRRANSASWVGVCCLHPHLRAGSRCRATLRTALSRTVDHCADGWIYQQRQLVFQQLLSVPTGQSLLGTASDRECHLSTRWL